MFGRGDASPGNRGTSALPLIGLWKMLDNLRRTLSAPASVMALLAGWILSLHSAAVWTCCILSTIAVPTAGCWQLTLQWRDQRAEIDLEFH